MKRKIASVMVAALILTPSLPVSLCSANVAAATNYSTYVNGKVYAAQFEGTSYEQTVFFPKELTSSSKKYPVVVWGNGTFASWDVYEELLSQISAGGYIVVANDDRYCGSGESESASVDFIVGKNSDKNSIFYNKVDVDHIGAGGHSQGGMSAVNASLKNSKIDCVFDIAGCQTPSEASQLKVPTFFMSGTKDLVVNALWVKNTYNKCKAPAVYASLKNGYHLDPVDTHSPAVYVEYALNWFDAFLKNDSKAKAGFLKGGKLSKDSRWVNYASKNF